MNSQRKDQANVATVGRHQYLFSSVLRARVDLLQGVSREMMITKTAINTFHAFPLLPFDE